MRIYAESNFVLEIALLQEQRSYCEALVELSESGQVALVLPAFALAEPFDTLGRHRLERLQLKEALDVQLRQLERTEDYKHLLSEFRSVTSLLTESGNAESRRLDTLYQRLLDVARLVQLDAEVFRLAADCRRRHDLSAQDAVIYASILADLRSKAADECCFLTRDRRGFDEVDIAKELSELGCRLIHDFENGHRFVRGRLEG